MSTTDWLAAAEGPLEPIAYHGLDGRPGFKLALTVEAGRHFLYVSHLWHSGWSVLDVTDPASPQHVRFIPGPPGTWTLQVTLRGHLLATSLEPVPPDWGGNAGAVFSEGVFIWDIADPANPRQLGHFKTGDRGTHRNGFDELGILHLSARVAGQVGLILVLVHRFKVAAAETYTSAEVPQTVPQRTQALLQRHPDVNYIMIDIGAYAVYVVQGVKQLGPQFEKKVRLISFDCVPDEVARVAVRDVQWACVGAASEASGWAAIDELNRALNRQPRAGNRVPVQLITQENHAGVTTPGVGYTGGFDYKAEWRKFWGK